VVAMDSLVGQQGPGASAHAGGMPSPPPSAILLPRGDHGQTASSTLCAPLLITRTLMRGSRGSDVTNLQNTLILQGLLASSSATGFFGLLTEKAVAQWQHQEGIASSTTPDQSQGIGMIGPRSRAAFAKCEGRVGQMLSNGSKSPDFDHGSTTPPRPPVPPTATTSPQQ